MQRGSPESPFMNERRAAAFLELSTQTLQRWRTLGTGPRYCKLGGAIRYTREDLLGFADERKRRSTADRAEAPREQQQ